MTPLIPIFILIVTILFLLIFVIAYSSIKNISMIRLEHKHLKKQIDSVKEEIKKEYEHLLANIKNISDSMLCDLDDKHDEIEEVGEKYIKLIKKNENENNRNNNCSIANKQ